MQFDTRGHEFTHQYVTDPISIAPLGPQIDNADGASQLQTARKAYIIARLV